MVKISNVALFNPDNRVSYANNSLRARAVDDLMSLGNFEGHPVFLELLDEHSVVHIGVHPGETIDKNKFDKWLGIPGEYSEEPLPDDEWTPIMSKDFKKKCMSIACYELANSSIDVPGETHYEGEPPFMLELTEWDTISYKDHPDREYYIQQLMKAAKIPDVLYKEQNNTRFYIKLYGEYYMLWIVGSGVIPNWHPRFLEYLEKLNVVLAEELKRNLEESTV